MPCDPLPSLDSRPSSSDTWEQRELPRHPRALRAAGVEPADPSVSLIARVPPGRGSPRYLYGGAGVGVGGGREDSLPSSLHAPSSVFPASSSPEVGSESLA
jgi:hypothetical protein